MNIYYSASPRGFYHAADFGSRTILIPDPQWLRPTLGMVLAPGDSITVDGEVVENASEEPMTVSVPDETAVCPLIEQENPACRIPADALPISTARHLELLEGQAQGKLIRTDAEGYPILVDPPSATPAQLAASESKWRDAELQASESSVARHRDERDLGRPTSLSDAEFAELLEYRQALRDWSAAEGFPAIDQRPPRPAWLNSALP